MHRMVARNPFDRPTRPFVAGGALPLEYLDDIQASLDVSDFVQGLLLENSLAVVYGESNSGKTFWTTDLALHVACGMTWNGRRVEQGGVIYCALEGGQGCRNRIAAWREHHKPPNFGGHFALVPSQVNMLDQEQSVDPLIVSVKAATLKMGVPTKLVVIDTLSRALAGGNENGPEDMGELVLNVDRLRQETGAMVLFVHHSGKSAAQGARGHSLLRGAIDTEIEVKEHDGGLRTATVEKQRETRKGDEFQFRLDVLELGKNRYGEAVTTCIVNPTGEPGQQPTPEQERRKLPQTARRALDVLADLCAASGAASQIGTPSGSISVPEDAWRDKFYDRALPGADSGAKRKAFRAATDRLITTQMVGMGGGRVWLAERRHVDEPPPPDDTEIPE